MSEHSGSTHSKKKLLALSLGALGVVFGDIGTSPLYAINQMFFGHSHNAPTVDSIFGGISLVFWALTILISIKYIIFVMRADNDGEGGVFALYGLLDKVSSRAKIILGALLIIAAGLLFGDGIITPAISVLSAVEGLSVATRALDPYIVPITIAILSVLFLIQSKGTASVGKVFGPIVIVWFVSIGLIGFSELIQVPQILQALNPMYAINFLLHNDIRTVFLTLGAVMLAVTGGEAMYADMGHFGKAPIRISWFSLVYPALILNYLGQGAFLLSGKSIVENNLFYSMVPSMLILPMVILATCATVIASQALISGAFSLSAQGISLGLFPYLPVIHTSSEYEGQIYVPFVNWALYIGCIILVVMFKTSGHLASAYGLAVSGVMLVTSLAMVQIARHYWKWSPFRALLLFVPLICIDSLFLTANLVKIIDGGYIPLMIGFALLIIMTTWQWGRARVSTAFRSYPSMTVGELINIKKNSNTFLPRSIIIMSPELIDSFEDKLPALKQMFWERYGMLPQHLIFLTVAIKKTARVKHDNRFLVTKLFEQKEKGSVTSVQVNFGYLEDPNVEKVLESLAAHKEISIDADPKEWLIHVVHERVRFSKEKGTWDKMRFYLFRYLLRNTFSADHYFGLGRTNNLTMEVLPVSIP
ncbi:MAG TPA: KUP/HAK/KT family potassium transporter [Candidatus Saccharimonadales bacterium]|nr:KUP/HAK/KT family potassium transporter [Candidatus Saccharimonadales bacterium]